MPVAQIDFPLYRKDISRNLQEYKVLHVNLNWFISIWHRDSVRSVFSFAMYAKFNVRFLENYQMNKNKTSLSNILRCCTFISYWSIFLATLVAIISNEFCIVGFI